MDAFDVIGLRVVQSRRVDKTKPLKLPIGEKFINGNRIMVVSSGVCNECFYRQEFVSSVANRVGHPSHQHPCPNIGCAFIIQSYPIFKEFSDGSN